MSAMFASQLKARAEVIAADLPGRIAYGNAQRDLAPETIAALHEAELFRLFKPHRFGGLEADPALFYDLQNVLAERDLSVAWVFGVLNIQAFILMLFSEQAQEDVWGDNPQALASSSFAPSGTVERVDGGYRISGQWGWSSGSSFAQWALLGGLIPPEAEGAPPQMRLFLVPRADYEIVDTWHTFGLRGTGSNDIRVAGAFVPEHRTLAPRAPLAMSAEAGLAPLQRLPWLFMFSSCIGNLGIGASRGAVKALAAARAAQPGGGDERGRMILGRAHGAIEAANTTLQHNIGVLWAAAKAGTVPPADEVMLYRNQLSGMLRGLFAHVDELMLLSGGRGMRDGGPLTQTWLDLSAARHHMGNVPDAWELGSAQALIGA